MEPDIAIGLIYYAMERNFPTSPANQEIREALTMAMCTRMLGSTKVQRNDFCSYGRSAKIET